MRRSDLKRGVIYATRDSYATEFTAVVLLVDAGPDMWTSRSTYWLSDARYRRISGARECDSYRRGTIGHLALFAPAEAVARMQELDLLAVLDVILEDFLASEDPEGFCRAPELPSVIPAPSEPGLITGSEAVRFGLLTKLRNVRGEWDDVMQAHEQAEREAAQRKAERDLREAAAERRGQNTLDALHAAGYISAGFDMCRYRPDYQHIVFSVGDAERLAAEVSK